MSIPIEEYQGHEALGYLLPTNFGHLKNESVLESMTNWRSSNQHAYTGRFNPTVEKTAVWLNSQVLNNPDRLLFLVANREGNPIGHLGLAVNETQGTMEIDNVVRGEISSPGLMGLAMATLERFAESELSVESLSLRVLGSNEKALRFYSNCGYSTISETPVDIKYSDDFHGVRGALRDTFVLMEKRLPGNPRSEVILTAGPLVGSLEASYALDAARNGWNGRHSDYLAKFEREFADFVGAKYAMATSSCSGALHLALLSAGIGPGDEVIVPEITWVATASAVAYTGATPVFCDVELGTWTLDLGVMESKITNRTKAVIPVHLYGFPAKIREICQIAKRHGIRVIEDAAPAIGATQDGKAVGTFGDIGCFSFQGAKLLVTGEGGMLTTDDEELFNRAKKLQDHGRRPGTFWIDELGYKYKMSNVTAAIGLAQIRRAENQIFRKQRIRQWYEDALGHCESLVFQKAAQNSLPIHWMTSIRLLDEKSQSAKDLMAGLGAVGIDTRPVFPPLSQFNFWKGSKQEPGINSLKISEGGLNLPSGVGLSRSTVEYVSARISELLRA